MLSSNKDSIQRKSLVILVFALFAGIITGLFILENPFNNDSTTAYNTGEVITRDSFELEIRDMSVQEFIEPNSNTTLYYAVVDLSIQNTGDGTFPFIPVFQTELQSSDDQSSYTMSPYPSLEDPISAGELEVGQKNTGELSYLIEDPEELLYFIFNPFPDDPDSESITIKL